MVVLLLACSSAPPEPAGDVIFLRDAALVDGELRPLQWRPGEEHFGAVAPRRAECVPLFSEDLGDTSTLAALGGSAPDTALAFSPDGSLLAVGSYLGELLVLDGFTGQVKARRRLAETMVKQVAWSADGGTLYAAEQSPDAYLHAMSPDLEPRWSLRLADRVGSSAAPAGDSLYGVYDLPAAFGLVVLDGGDLLVTASHGWNGPHGRLNASQVLRVSPAGEVLDAWPEQPADALFMHPRVGDGRVVFTLTRSSPGPAPEGLPVPGVQVLSVEGLDPVVGYQPGPLEPWFSQAYVWEALDVSDRGLFVGMTDGRVRVVGLDGQERLALDAGTPVMAGEVPILAAVAHGALWGEQVAYLTSGTTIPWGAASPDLRPPAAHPAANTVWVRDLQGELAWSWTGELSAEGMTLVGDTLVLGGGPRRTDTRRDLFGAWVFDMAGEGGGAQRLRTVCSTAGPVFFRQAVADDGRIAVVEFPWAEGEQVFGAYRVTVLR